MAHTYISGHPVEKYVELFEAAHPAFADVLDFERAGTSEALEKLPDSSPEEPLNPVHDAGYRKTQQQGLPRATGIRQLLTAAAEEQAMVLNVVGGDGLMARTAEQLGVPLRIVTSDNAAAKVVSALRQGLPAIRQDATHLFVREAAFDAVLIAYETHHIDPGDRPQAWAEASRALRPGGRLVMSDFATDSPTARWFREIVHPLTDTGHDYEHFTAAELVELYTRAGFTAIQVGEIYDPIIVPGDTAQKAVANLVDYLISIYRLGGSTRPDPAMLTSWIRENLTYSDDALPSAAEKRVTKLTTFPVADGFEAVLPRATLMATGTKPH